MLFLKFLILVIIISIPMVLLFRSADKHSRKLQEKKDETLEYLNTVKKRANLTVMPESLILLFLEMEASCDKYEYHRDTFEEYKRISAYIMGKYHGLKKLSHKTL